MKYVYFRDHAAKALAKRLSINIAVNSRIDISKNFTFAQKYLHREKRIMCEAYCYNDLRNKVVLIVAQCNDDVMTVYIGGDLSERNAPFVDTMYRLAFPEHYKLTNSRGLVRKQTA